MNNKKELYSINDCVTIEDVKELSRQRYKRWYQANREKKLAYAREYREKYLNKNK
ncbi:hypothetical protein [Paraclostridium sordellii]|uniref:hypothetical protein n=1 Tax=Paraclostridium sordellii TaxID=1505 RepID=UPI001899A983|nr:hypothetical protein [Paeniclostridium sordellii]